MKQNWKSQLYLAACGICFAASLGHLIYRSFSETEKPAVAVAATPKLLDQTDPETSSPLGDEAVQVFRSADRQSISDLANKLAGMDWNDLPQVYKALRPYFEKDPKAGLEFLKQLCAEIATKNPENALELAFGLSEFPEVTTLERSLLQEWSQKDTGKILESVAKRGDTANVHHLSILASLVQNERKDLLPKLLDWVAKIPTNESITEKANRDLLLGELSNKLVTHVTPDTLLPITEFLVNQIQHPVAAANLANIAPVYVTQYPDKGIEWLNSLQADNQTRSMIFGSAIQGLAEINPDEAARLLSADHFIEKYYRPDKPDETPEQATKQKEAFFDNMLNNYIRSTIREDPELAYENAKVFFNKELQTEIQTWANELTGKTDSTRKSTN